MFTDKTILITGATGFIGYHLVKEIAINNLVYCIVRRSSNIENLKEISRVNFIYYDGNISNLELGLCNIKFDLTINLASLFIAEHNSADIDSLIDSNVKFPTQLLEILTKYDSNVKFLNVGTSWQNFSDKDYNPTCLYAATKQSFECIIKYFCELRNVYCITLRLYDTYGPKDNRKKLFWLLNQLKLTGNSLDMSFGKQKLNLLHIYDVVNAFIKASEYLMNSTVSINKIYGVYSSTEYELMEVVRIYESIHDCKLNINWGKKSYRVREIMNPQYPYTLLENWKEEISLEVGLKCM